MENTVRVLPFSPVTSSSIHAVAKEPAAPPPGSIAGFAGQAFVLNGPSAAMAKLWSQLQRVAPYFRTALLVGEEGTGTEVAARALHEASPFRERTLRILSPSAAEEYFAPGGAFTRGSGQGAYFLENVDKLSTTAQQGLLQIVKLRGPRSACVIAYTRTDLRALVGAGIFSGELAMALSGLRLQLPALRERREDIPALAQAITALCAQRIGRLEPALTAEFLDAARQYEWPRNLDQMGEMISWLLRHRAGTAFRREDFEAACAVYEPRPEEPQRTVRMVRLETMVQEHIRAVLQACNGNKQKAAEVLGISRSTLYRMLDAGAPYLVKAG